MKINQYYDVPIEREFDCRQCGTHIVVTNSKDKRVVFCSSVCEKKILEMEKQTRCTPQKKRT